ncbi:hypothetical protein NVIRPANT_00978 [Pantoea sp. Nvir]|nr:hypothetical protein NVIRPANT_00978 [Pantoea sp. Nvir]
MRLNITRQHIEINELLCAFINNKFSKMEYYVYKNNPINIGILI